MKFPIDKATALASKLYSIQPYYCRDLKPEDVLKRCKTDEELDFYYEKICKGE